MRKNATTDSVPRGATSLSHKRRSRRWSGRGEESARPPRIVSRAPRAFKMAGAISKQGGQGSNLFPRRNRAFHLGDPSSPTVRAGGPVEHGGTTVVGTRHPGCRAHSPPASGSTSGARLGPARVGEYDGRWSVCLHRCSACVLSTAVHSGSLGERTHARARARCIIIASRNCCDTATCLCAILSCNNAV